MRPPSGWPPACGRPRSMPGRPWPRVRPGAAPRGGRPPTMTARRSSMRVTRSGSSEAAPRPQPGRPAARPGCAAAGPAAPAGANDYAGLRPHVESAMSRPAGRRGRRGSLTWTTRCSGPWTSEPGVVVRAGTGRGHAGRFTTGPYSRMFASRMKSWKRLQPSRPVRAARSTSRSFSMASRGYFPRAKL